MVLMSPILRADVRGGQLIVEDRVDLPEGAEVQLRIVDGTDELDEDDRALLHREIELSRDEASQKDTVSAEDVLADFRSRSR